MEVNIVNTKIYIDMNVTFEKNGSMLLISFKWPDGTIFHIDKVLNKQFWYTSSRGSSVYRYTCLIKGKKRYIFCDNNKWYMELHK